MIARLRAARRSRPLHLSLSLALLVLSALFVAELMNFGKDELTVRRESRKMISEALVVQLTTLASADNRTAIEYSVGEFVRRNAQVAAARLTDRQGTSITEYGDVGRIDTELSASTLDQVIVPIFEGRRPWGEVRVAFEPVDGRWEQIRYFAVVLGVAFTGFVVFLGRALVQLDPSAVVPRRVSTAFDMFSEGVFVLDDSLRILLANAATASIVGDVPSALIGKRLDDWSWVSDDEQPMPWSSCSRSGHDVSDQPLTLGADRPRRFMVSCAAIGGDDGAVRGLMVTFDDVTELQEKNRALSSTLSQISKKNEELVTLASRDPLTGLLNRRALMEAFDEAVSEARSGARALSCIMLDIDHFKNINDTYGHAIGDEAICAVATTLQRHCRPRDSIGRYGGEEYVIALPDTDAADALVLAEKLREAVGRLCDDAAFAIETLSISLGVEELRAAEDTASALIDRADKALYTAKEAGRNRSVRYGTGTAGDGSNVQDGKASAASDASAQVGELESLLLQRERELERLRDFDALTGTPRRPLFVDALEQDIRRTGRLGKSLGVLAFEIQDLSRISASCGSDLVDALVVQFVERLRDGLRRSDLVSAISDEHRLSRIAPNEYAVLLSDLDESGQAVPVLTRLRRLLSTPFELADQKIYLGVNVGIAVSAHGADSAERLLDAALQARHAATSAGEKFSFSFASDSLDEMSRRYIELEAMLFDAVDNGRFQVHYQPKLDLATRRIHGMEALIRWFHPDRGQLSPAEFIPIAEASGLIHDIYSFVLGRALDDLGNWRRQGHTELCVSINLSGAQLREPELVADTLQRIADAGIATWQIELELTETAVIDSPNRARIALGQLRDAGVAISMDDFGTGYTSLALLADLPLDSVKIDRSFINAMSDSDRGHAVVESVVRMAHALDLRVVAEGVETSEQLGQLERLGCNQAQGYLISKPVPAEAISALLERQGALADRTRAA